jgi:hypothetical protein
MKATMVLAIALALQGCKSPSEARREQFVREFLASIRQDSQFFRRYVKEDSRLDLILSNVRPRLSADFAVLNREAHGDGSFEYAVRCGTRATCLVFLFENDGKLIEADVMLSEK